jgi:hypothetical protein
MSLTPARSAAGFALLVTLATGCGIGGTATTSAGQHRAPGSPAVGTAPAAAGATPAAAAGAPAACSLLKRADVLAVAAAFPHDTITIDGHSQHSEAPTNECGYNQKGVFPSGDGITMTLSGDQWASLTVVSGGADYAFNPTAGQAINGLGDGAYWDPGSNTVVVRVGHDVLQVVDNVPANAGSTPAVAVAYRRAAQALAAKILARMG